MIPMLTIDKYTRRSPRKDLGIISSICRRITKELIPNETDDMKKIMFFFIMFKPLSAVTMAFFK